MTLNKHIEFANFSYAQRCDIKEGFYLYNIKTKSKLTFCKWVDSEKIYFCCKEFEYPVVLHIADFQTETPQRFKTGLADDEQPEQLAELNTIIQRDQEIKDRLKVLFAEHSKALTEAIETNKRIETLIINL
jgi:hypothetical protein